MPLPRSNKHRLFAYPSRSVGGVLRSFYDTQADDGVPDLPIFLGETTLTTQQVTVTPNGAESYRLYVNGVFNQSMGISEEIFALVEDLTPGTLYHYYAESYLDGELTARSRTLSRRTVDADLPEAPVGLELTPGFPPFLLAEWDDLADPSVNNFSIQYRRQGDTDFTSFETGDTDLAAAINSLDAVTPYEVAVAAINDNGQGEYSDLATATTLLNYCPVPIDLTPSDFDVETVSAGVVEIRWTHPENITFYGNFHYSVLVEDVENTTTTDNFVSVMGLDNNAQYDVVVKLVVIDDEDVEHVSDPSNQITIQTLIFLDIFAGGSAGETLAGSFAATGNHTFIETGAAVFNTDDGVGAEWANDGSDTFESTVFFDAVADKFRCTLPSCFVKGFVLPFSVYFNYDRNTLDGWKLEVFSGKYSLYRLDAGTPTEVATFTGSHPGTEYPDDNMYIDFLVDRNFISGVFSSSQGRSVDDLVYEIPDRPYQDQTGFGFGIYGGDLTFDDGVTTEVLSVVGRCQRIVMRQLPIYVPPPTLWDPSHLGEALVEWYSADNVSTTDDPDVEGGTIATSVNGAINGLTLSPLSSFWKYDSTGINGKPSLRVVGSGSAYQTSGNHSTTDAMVLMSALLSADQAFTARILDWTGYNAGCWFGVGDADNKRGGGVRWTSGSPYGTYIDGVNDAWQTIALYRDSANSHDGIWLQGDWDNRTVHTTSDNNPFDTGKITIAGDGGGSSGVTAMSWRNIIIASAFLSDSDRQKCEGFIAHDEGRLDDLPSDHPYKVDPPYV